MSYTFRLRQDQQTKQILEQETKVTSMDIEQIVATFVAELKAILLGKDNAFISDLVKKIENNPTKIQAFQDPYGFRLKELIGNILYIHLQQFDHFTCSPTHRKKLDSLIEKMFYNTSPERTYHGLLIALSLGLLDKKDDKSPSKELLACLILPDIIFSKAYVQNYLLDLKNTPYRTDDPTFLHTAWEYFSYLIQQILGNLGIEQKVVKNIKHTIDHMEASIHIGQAFDALLLRITQHSAFTNITLQEIKNMIETKKITNPKVTSRSSIPSNPAYRGNEQIDLYGLDPQYITHAINIVIEELGAEGTKLLDLIKGGKIHDIRYRFISGRYYTLLIDLFSHLAEGMDIVSSNEIQHALQTLYQSYGTIAQRTNDFTDLIMYNKPKRIGYRNKSPIDAMADITNKMQNEVFIFLNDLKESGTSSETFQQITSTLCTLGFTNITPFTDSVIELHGTYQNTSLFDIPEDTIAKYFIETGVGVLLQTKNRADRKYGSEHLLDLLKQQEQEGGTTLSTNQIVGIILSSAGTSPLKTSNIEAGRGTKKSLELKTGNNDFQETFGVSKRNVLSLSRTIPSNPNCGYLRYSNEEVVYLTGNPVHAKVKLPKKNEVIHPPKGVQAYYEKYIASGRQRCAAIASQLGYIIPPTKKKTIEHLLSCIYQLITLIQKENDGKASHHVIDTSDIVLDPNYENVLYFFTQVEIVQKIIVKFQQQWMDGGGTLWHMVDQVDFAKSLTEDEAESYNQDYQDLKSGLEYIKISINNLGITAGKRLGYLLQTLNQPKKVNGQLLTDIKDILTDIAITNQSNRHMQDSQSEIQFSGQPSSSPDNVSGYGAFSDVIGILNKFYDKELTYEDTKNQFFDSLLRVPSFFFVLTTMKADHQIFFQNICNMLREWTRVPVENRTGPMFSPTAVAHTSEKLLIDIMTYLQNKSCGSLQDIYSRHIRALQWLLDQKHGIQSQEIRKTPSLLTSPPTTGSNKKNKTQPMVFTNPDDAQQAIYRNAYITNYYTQLIHRRQPGYKDLLDTLFADIQKTFSHTEDHVELLDVGCGNAHVLINMITKAPDIKVDITGVDLSHQMIALGQQEVKKHQLNQKIILQQEDFLERQSEKQYDIITTNLTTHNVYGEGKITFIKNMVNALKPGGVGYITDAFCDEERRYTGMQRCISSIESHKQEIERTANNHHSTYQEVLDLVIRKEIFIDFVNRGMITTKEMIDILIFCGAENIEIIASTDTNISTIKFTKPKN